MFYLCLTYASTRPINLTCYCRGEPQVCLGSYFRLQYNNDNNNISGLVSFVGWLSVLCLLGWPSQLLVDSTNISNCYFLLMF